MWTTLRTISTARFSVALQCTYDETDLRGEFDAATIAGINRGDYAAYCFRVVVLCDGREIGADYLGGSVYSDPADFAREHFGIAPKGRAAGVTYCVYFPDMLRAAILEARRALRNLPRLRHCDPAID
jgi:hypothetical protein